ncbi:hypothetical protein HLVA_03280 [Haliovirga abyssi]|uniref:Uncharacterized protein n=1 Tax=Haliovirga abyssi TaxID=2996794 RepID=A0AAU9D1B3_9FUSO|nr:hypothetical protein HLVA_03280 [Haliovirga abyssi]
MSIMENRQEKNEFKSGGFMDILEIKRDYEKMKEKLEEMRRHL